MSDYVVGQWINVCVCVCSFPVALRVCVCVHICFYCYVLISIFTDLCNTGGEMYRLVHTCPGKARCVHAEKQLLNAQFPWWMGLSISVTTVQMARHVIKNPSALLLPPLLTLLTTLSLPQTHTDTSPVPGPVIIYSTFLQRQSNYEDGNLLG